MSNYRISKFVKLTGMLVSAAALSACATTGPVATPGQTVVTRDVLISVRAPCPDEKDLLTPPKTIHEEHPTPPTNAVPVPKDKADVAGWIASLKGEIVAGHGRERILADKVLEQQNWIGRADRIMRACAKPSQAPASPK